MIVYNVLPEDPVKNNPDEVKEARQRLEFLIDELYDLREGVRWLGLDPDLIIYQHRARSNKNEKPS